MKNLKSEDHPQRYDESLKELRKLVRDYHRLLRVIHPGHWQKVMTPFWIGQKDKIQQRAQELLGEEKP